MIKKVFVIHKTHLDIGFTDMAENVLKQYVDVFIPRAIETAYECNGEGKRNFVWTVGSFLIEYYLEHAEHPEKLEQAIRDGYIAWHGLALTTHTELMDERLFRYELEISKRLDARFGKKTISAKMTDVPCHTHAIVPLLEEYGIQYLHIGINSSSKVVDIPPICRFCYGDSEIVLNYASQYGGADTFGDYALEFAHTADNMGPPAPERVWAEIARLQDKYPGAEIVSSTMDEFAVEVLKRKDTLPRVTEELGDTWIHGVATDPYKVGAYCELLRLRDQWLTQEPEAENTSAYRELSRNLMLVCEHTWGRDSKRWFSDYKNWEKADFQAAKVRDVIRAEDTIPAGKLISDAAVQQKTFQNGECRYSAIEKSWDEQRNYVSAAASALPEPWYSKALAQFALLQPEVMPECKKPADSRSFEINGYCVEVQRNGALAILGTPEGDRTKKTVLGSLLYHTYGWRTVRENYETYNRDLERTRVWSEPDFAKPGLDSLQDLEDHCYEYSVKEAEQCGKELRIWLEAPEEAFEEFGAPRKAVVTYAFGDEIMIELQWFDKDASRIPEGIFFHMNIGAEDPEKLKLYKMNREIKPYHVRKGGNRKLHVSAQFVYEDIKVESLDAPLLSVGGEHLYDVDESFGDIRQGLSYVLFDNRWNTNFRLWYEENASFRFKINL